MVTQVIEKRFQSQMTIQLIVFSRQGHGDSHSEYIRRAAAPLPGPRRGVAYEEAEPPDQGLTGLAGQEHGMLALSPGAHLLRRAISTADVSSFDPERRSVMTANSAMSVPVCSPGGGAVGPPHPPSQAQPREAVWLSTWGPGRLPSEAEAPRIAPLTPTGHTSSREAEKVY